MEKVLIAYKNPGKQFTFFQTNNSIKVDFISLRKSMKIFLIPSHIKKPVMKKLHLVKG